MFVRSNTLRCLGSWKNIFCLIRFHQHSQSILIHQKSGVDSFCKLASRCYSKFNDDEKKQLAKSSRSEKQEDELDEEDTLELLEIEKDRRKLSESVLPPKYTIFKDEDAPIILDVEEERFSAQASRALAQPDEFEGVSLNRGIHGVFDTEELVSILKKQSATDIFVVEIPTEMAYASHMVIISGRSSRHISAMATYVRRLFKKKMLNTDKVPIIEGKKKKCDDWLALDLGNIILHLFLKGAREQYDLESLWALGAEFDPHLKKVETDPLSTIIKKHSVYLSDLQPAK